MGKISQKVTKDPMRQERDKKSYETHMKRIIEKLLEELSTLSPTDRSTPSTPSSTEKPTLSTPSSMDKPAPSISSYTDNSMPSLYAYGILAVLAIGVCIFFSYNKKAGQVMHGQPIKPKRRHML